MSASPGVSGASEDTHREPERDETEDVEPEEQRIGRRLVMNLSDDRQDRREHHDHFPRERP